MYMYISLRHTYICIMHVIVHVHVPGLEGVVSILSLTGRGS